MVFWGLARRITLIAAAMWGTVGSAQEAGGTLIFLDLPEGATVRLNQVPVVLERDARRGAFVMHPEATVDVMVEVPGLGVALATADVVDGSVTTIQYKDGQLDAGRTGVGLVLPGLTQLTEGRPVVGGAVLLGLVGTAAGSVWAGRDMADARRAAGAAAMRYDMAMNEADAVAAREAHALAVSEAESARTKRMAFVAVGTAVYLASAVDVLLNHSRGVVLEASAPRRPIVAFRPIGNGVALQIRL